MILQSLQFILFCVQKMILYQIVARISKTLFFWWHCALHWWEGHVTAEDFDCSFTFYPGTPTKTKEINRERNYISRSCEKSKCIASNDRYNCFIGEQHNSNIFLNPYRLWDMVPAALMSLNHTNNTYSMFNQYPQLATQQPRTVSNPVFSSLGRMNNQRKGLRVSFDFFQRNYLQDGRVNEIVATVEELSGLWKPGAIAWNSAACDEL